MSYEEILRTIGNWMDERRPRRITVLETPAGFTARWRWDHHVHEACLKHFARDELDALERGQQLKSTPHQSAPGNSTARPPHTYQNVLRALGHELDQVSAESLLLDEVEGLYLITYQYQNPIEAGYWRKHMALVSLHDQETLLKRAQARRRVRTGSSGTWSSDSREG